MIVVETIMMIIILVMMMMLVIMEMRWDDFMTMLVMIIWLFLIVAYHIENKEHNIVTHNNHFLTVYILIIIYIGDIVMITGLNDIMIGKNNSRFNPISSSH